MSSAQNFPTSPTTPAPVNPALVSGQWTVRTLPRDPHPVSSSSQHTSRRPRPNSLSVILNAIDQPQTYPQSANQPPSISSAPSSTNAPNVDNQSPNQVTLEAAKLLIGLTPRSQTTPPKPPKPGFAPLDLGKLDATTSNLPTLEPPAHLASWRRYPDILNEPSMEPITLPPLTFDCPRKTTNQVPHHCNVPAPLRIAPEVPPLALQDPMVLGLSDTTPVTPHPAFENTPGASTTSLVTPLPADESEACAPKPIDMSLVTPRPVDDHETTPSTIDLSLATPRPVDQRAITPGPISSSLLSAQPADEDEITPRPVRTSTNRQQPVHDEDEIVPVSRGRKSKKRALAAILASAQEAEGGSDHSIGPEQLEESEPPMKTRRRTRGPKNIRCPQCPVLFRQLSAMRSHIRVVHQGEKRFKCPRCEVSFGASGDVTRHVQSVHEDRRPHKCPLCEQKFARPATMRRHCISVHKDDPRNPFTFGGANT